MDTTGTKRTKEQLSVDGFTGCRGAALFSLIRLLGNLHRVLGCFFHGAVNIFEGVVEAAGRDPAAFNELNNDFFGGSQYLFVDGRHVAAPLTRIRLSASLTHQSSLSVG